MPNSQKGVASVVVLIILLVGLVGGVYAVQNARTILNPQAAEPYSCPDDFEYCDTDVGKIIYKTGGKYDANKEGNDKCIYAFLETDKTCGQENYTPVKLPNWVTSKDGVCIPGEWEPGNCNSCNSQGIAWGDEGTDWGNGNNKDAWCACAKKYSASTGRGEFNQKNYSQCLGVNLEKVCNPGSRNPNDSCSVCNKDGSDYEPNWGSGDNWCSCAKEYRQDWYKEMCVPKVCQPGEIGQHQCSRCKSDGSGFETNWGEEGSRDWCGCAYAYDAEQFKQSCSAY